MSNVRYWLYGQFSYRSWLKKQDEKLPEHFFINMQNVFELNAAVMQHMRKLAKAAGKL